MSKEDNSFESEGCSDCEEDEIKSKENSKNKEELEENNDPTKLPNYVLIKSISKTLVSILENNKKSLIIKKLLKSKAKWLLVQI